MIWFPFWRRSTELSPNDVVVISNRTQEVGFVVDGLVRDAVELIDLEVPGPLSRVLPGWSAQGPCGNPRHRLPGVPVSIGGATVTPGTWVFGDADGLIILEAHRLPAVFEGAGAASEQEETLTREIASATPLGDAFELESSLTQRSEDPQADFNLHLAQINRAI